MTTGYDPLDYKSYYDRRIFCWTSVAVISAIGLGILGTAWGMFSLKDGCDLAQCMFLPDTDGGCLVVAQDSRNRTQTCLETRSCHKEPQGPCYFKPRWNHGGHPCFSLSCANTPAVIMLCLGASLAFFGACTLILMMHTWYGATPLKESPVLSNEE